MVGLKKYRRWARERAVQFLFQVEINPPVNLEEALQEFWANCETEEELKESISHEHIISPSEKEAAKIFAEELIKGVLAYKEIIDTHLMRLVKNWDIKRLAGIDRNVLRLAMYEMMCRHDIPYLVSINEAIEIAKKFSTEESGKFVNGVLDSFRIELLSKT